MTAAPSASSRKRPAFMRINHHSHMKKIFFVIASIVIIPTIAFAQPDTATKRTRKVVVEHVYLEPIKRSTGPDHVDVYPTNWWVGMKYSKPELMIHLTDIGNVASISVNYPGVTI